MDKHDPIQLLAHTPDSSDPWARRGDAAKLFLSGDSRLGGPNLVSDTNGRQQPTPNVDALAQRLRRERDRSANPSDVPARAN